MDASTVRHPERMDVRLVPISAEQVKAIESLENALRGLADDFHRDVGGGESESIAGGLYRLWSTLEAIRTMWHAAGERAIVGEERGRP